MYVYNSTSCNSEDMESTQMTIVRQMDKEIMCVSFYQGKKRKFHPGLFHLSSGIQNLEAYIMAFPRSLGRIGLEMEQFGTWTTAHKDVGNADRIVAMLQFWPHNTYIFIILFKIIKEASLSFFTFSFRIN